MTDTASQTSDPLDSAAGLFCPHCGYDLRGIESSNCPECGESFDRATISRSQLPWVHRKKIGGFRAFWRTARMSTLRISHIAREKNVPVSLRDAQLFRLIITLVAAATMGSVAIIWRVSFPELNASFVFEPLVYATSPSPVPLDILLPLVTGYLLMPISPIAFWIFLMLATGVGSYLFHPNHLPVILQNRAVALSYYACGPLVWLPFLVIATESILLIFIAATGPFEIVTTIGSLAGVACALFLILGVACCWNTVRLLALTTQQRFFSSTLKMLFIILLWLAAAVIGLLGVPWLAGYVYLFFDSLR